MEAWFLSDIHIKTMHERNSEILLRFLHSLKNKNPQEMHLFLLGDIFDLWIGGHDTFVEKFRPIVEAVADLKKAGARVIYIEGNHDLYIDPFWQKKLGAEVFVEAQFFEVNGVKIRVEHGDLINLEDKAYLRYRSVVRHPLTKHLTKLIPGNIWDKIGNYAARKSRVHSQRYRSNHEEKLVQMIRRHAHRTYNEEPYDFIISGHMHVYDDYEFQVKDAKARSINLGSWYGPEVKVLRLVGKQLEWVTIK